MRAAITVNPAKSDVAEIRGPIEKTFAAAGWSAYVVNGLRHLRVRRCG